MSGVVLMAETDLSALAHGVQPDRAQSHRVKSCGKGSVGTRDRQLARTQLAVDGRSGLFDVPGGQHFVIRQR